MTTVRAAIDTFRRATDLNLEDPIRSGSLLCPPDYSQVVMTGDMHGHRRNFEKLIKYCQLECTPTRHVLLHELIHEQPQQEGWVDRSVELLLDAAKWKTFFPDQVHFLQSNHELAQLQNHEITKGGRMVTDDFERGVAEVLDSNDIDEVLIAIDDFIASYPLAARSPNGIFFSHSLPNVSHMDDFDPALVHEPADALDLSEGGMVYQMVWGRRHTPALLERLAHAFEVHYFISGHQPQEFGYEVRFDRMIILASDHNHGVFLPVDCRKQYTIEDLVQRIRPFAGVI
ncbi:MAG TPA: metallophosphoesterase [Phycisphaerae bacterium]|nr:metallophosphoesterase [Phycisphaerae bacterium]HRR85979.1 metallophosphoesterase [Phycisphaerae bacterium]